MMLHDVLHGIFVGRGSGKSISELKLSQDMVSVEHNPLLLVLLELRKAYENLGCGQILKTLEGYRAGPKMRGNIAYFWPKQEVVALNWGPWYPFFR